jgi:prepilin-type N-terminal cleavage/methylation domain-containing protein
LPAGSADQARIGPTGKIPMPTMPTMPPMSPMPQAEPTRRRDRRGFALVELVVVVLILAAVAAVVVFSVKDATGHSTKTNACAIEARVVQAAIVAYKTQHGGSNPKYLGAVAKAGWLQSLPGPSTPSGAAGYSYHATTGTYSGGICPS